jgi:hypothetical protein
MNRRKFILNNTVLLTGMLVKPSITYGSGLVFPNQKFVSKRPPIEERTYTSKAVEETIKRVKSKIADHEIAWMFENCYPNTLDTTVYDYDLSGKPDTYIITGDIRAMWLRDSTAQVWPYMPMINEDEGLKSLILGLINRQVKYVLHDPYANAFIEDLNRVDSWHKDIPERKPGVHERKWELDSLCYVVRISHEYYKLTSDASLFDEDWNKAMRLIVDTFKTEQRWDLTTPYRFIRKTTNAIDIPPFEGTGRPIKPTGMICSTFRPSDDATMFSYLVPSNVFAILSLNQLYDIYSTVLNDPEFANECKALGEEVDQAVKKYAITEHLDFGKIYAYEVDGLGNRLFMDDANVPSLMSLAYLGAHDPSDKIYKNTRKFLLSTSNPYFMKGKAAEGQGSPHTGKEKIWPMGIILRAMTSTDEEEIRFCLKMLKNTHANTGFMHESFHKDNGDNFSRKWFAWANTLFGELIIKIEKENPKILAKSFG